MRKVNVWLKNCIVLFHIKAFQLLINHSYMNLRQPLSLFILCFKLFPVFFCLSISVERKGYHVRAALLSNDVDLHVCSKYDFWRCQPNSMHACFLSSLLSVQESTQTNRKLLFGVHVAAKWFMQLAWRHSFPIGSAQPAR